MSLSDLFIDVKTLPSDGYGLFQLFFLGGVYAYVLCVGSNMISDGSELLLLIPSMAGMVGSIVLPILGAVPDGCIVLFSAVGPQAQEQLNVGIGALAGSTIMLLTIPWYLSVLGGRVDINIDKDGKPVCAYKAKEKLTKSNEGYFLSFGTGVSIATSVNIGAVLMIVSSFSYLLIEIPALIDMRANDDDSTAVVHEIGLEENGWAGFAAIVCTVFFIAYLWYMYIQADSDVAVTSQLEVIREAFKNGHISLVGVVCSTLEMNRNEKGGEKTPLNAGSVDPKKMDALRVLLKPFFNKYDTDRSGLLEKEELRGVLRDLGENPNKKEMDTLFKRIDVDGSGGINYDEFVKGMMAYALDIRPNSASAVSRDKFLATQKNSVESAEADEDEEMPEDLVNLSPEEQQWSLKKRSAWILGLGTLLVVLFSDPMVDVLNETGLRTGIPSFYVAFVLAPLASNASEVIASYNYASKKTTASMAISLSALQGACVMNNTFVLGIFMLLVWLQDLKWEFFAETASILLVIVIISFMSLKTNHNMFDATLILLLYPASILFVFLLEEVFKWN